jgi:chromate transporter
MADRTVSPAPEPPAAAGGERVVGWREALLAWTRIALLSFGGPAGQIAVMQRILVEEKRWVTQERFLHALNFCMLLPGPEAHQLTIYLAWLLRGTAAGIVAGVLFVLPGCLAVLGLSYLYVRFAGSSALELLFYGLAPAVLAVVLAALRRVAGRALDAAARRFVAGAAFLALFAFDVPYPLLVLGAAVAGAVLGRLGIAGFGRVPAGDPGTAAAGVRLSAAALEPPSWRRALLTLGAWLPLWWGPVVVLWLWRGADDVLVRQGIFFGQTALVTFGGAYAVLSYVAQRAVGDFGWLSPGEMVDGLAMAETTPGPLIIVLQFVAFLGAWRHPAELAPLVAAVAGSLVTTWVTFVPSFLFVFLGAPWIERLRHQRALADALAAITAAVVGVILELTMWFALHTWFGEVGARRWGLVEVPWPVLPSLEPWVLAITVLCTVLHLGRGLGMFATLGVGVLAGLAVRLLLGG